MPHKKVVIVGGGISGIKAAADLYKSGIKSTVILEAQPRLGGRLFTVESTQNKGTTYDYGASWFHDCLNNPLFDKAQQLENVKYYFDDGKSLYFNKFEGQIEKWRFETVLEEMMTYFQWVYKQDPDKLDISVKQLAQEYVDKYRNVLTKEQIELSLSAVRMWSELWHGESWDLLSGKYTFADDGHLGRNAFVKNGYSTVFINELKELPRAYRDSAIKLNAQVIKIDYTNKKKILVYLKDGRMYSCDYIIVTIPQTILKITNAKDENYVEWVPELPPNIQKVLPDVHFGSLGKVVLEFDDCFWPRDVDRFYGLTSNTPSQDTISVDAWDYPTILINYQAVNNVPSLVALTQNPLSKYIENLQPHEKQQRIWSIFKPLIAKICESKGIQEIPEPHSIYHTPWNNESLFRGSYGTSLVGTQDPSSVIKAFVDGYQDRIKFAGAETMDDTSNGCAHGGWFSGQREAKFIVQQEAKKKVDSKL
ncbi:non-specific polyamine oxidase [Candida albicans P75016]|nr:non-specific polyamine oxidase [Candida albicans P75016]